MEERGNDSEAEDILETVEDRAAGCALAILSSTSNTRQHCLQLIVDGPELQLWYYDAGGIIRSESMNWIKEFSKFAAIMVAFASLDASGWGVGIPNLVPPPSQLSTPLVLPTSLTGYSLTMAYRTQEDGTDIERNVRVELGKEITTQASLVGRRTTVYEVSTTPKISSVPLILKMSMQPTGRTPEYELLNDATAKGVQHLPKVLMWTEKKTEWRLSNGAWGKLFSDNEGDKDYKDRCQRMIVFPKYTPIKNVICAANMHTIFMQLIDCECSKLDVGSVFLLTSAFGVQASIV